MRALRVAVALLVVSGTAAATPLDRESIPTAGGEASGNSLLPALSHDGRYVAFVSDAPDLTPDDGDTIEDVFVRDRESGGTVLVSKSTGGTKGDGTSGDSSTYGQGGPRISADGRFVVFYSWAKNLVAGDTNAAGDIFVHDRDADADGVFDEPGAVRTVRVSVASDGTQANGSSQFPSISADGRVVAFASVATNLVPGDLNGQRDVFVHDRDADGDGVFDEPGAVSTERVSVGPGGVESNGESGRPHTEIAADGMVVGYLSYATNLVSGDTNDRLDVFVRNRRTGTTERVNVSSFEAETFYYDTYDFGLSGDGRWVAFTSQDLNLATAGAGYVAAQLGDILIRDRASGTTTTWTDATTETRRRRTSSYRPVLSYDGGIVAFYTRFGPMFDSTGQAAGHNQVEVYVHDRVGGTTVTQPIDASDGPATTVRARGIALSADARALAFDSEAGTLVPDDRNGKRDVFVDACPVVRPGDRAFAFCRPIAYEGLAAGDRSRFAHGSDQFHETLVPADGLGPVFNGASCAECHNRPWVGGTSDRRVTRFGADGPAGFDPLLTQGGPVLQAEGITTATCSVVGETVPSAATIVSARDVPALFGAGLIDALSDATILRLADPDDRNHDAISGRPNMVAGRVGRFGHKAQIATLRAFAGDAYLTEMGVTSPDFPLDVTSTCDLVADPEDDGTNVARFVDFMTLLAPLPTDRYPDRAQKRLGKRGLRAFRRIGCRGCHTDRLRAVVTTGPLRAGRQTRPFSDLLLHDMGPGLADGIEEGDATGTEFRTPPLWGVAYTAPYLHDGRAATLTAAIAAHGGEAEAARDAFLALSISERAEVLAFLGAL